MSTDPGDVHYTHISGSGTTVVVSQAGARLRRISVNTPIASATITVYDNTAGSGTVAALITLPSTVSNPFGLDMWDMTMNTGLTLVVVGVGIDITVVWF